MVKRITISELAREAGVSVSTVDRILSGRGSVKPATMRHVLAVAERLDFHATNSIRSRIGEEAPERSIGFLLNSQDRVLYRDLANILTQQVASAKGVRGRAIVHHLDSPDPAAAAEALMALGERCDAIGAVCVDHPYVNGAIEELASRGIPTVLMLSDVSSAARYGFIGSNDWQLGRTAGWFMDRLCPPKSKVAVLIGSDRYLSQQSQEASFRNFLRSGTGQMQMVEMDQSDESDETARRIVKQTIEAHPELRGIFAAGGGLEGCAHALREAGRSDITLIGTELSRSTEALLRTGAIDMIFAHPARGIASQVVSLLSQPAENPHLSPRIQLIPFDIRISENS